MRLNTVSAAELTYSGQCLGVAIGPRLCQMSPLEETGGRAHRTLCMEFATVSELNCLKIKSVFKTMFSAHPRA